MPEIDLTPVVVAVIFVFMPAILREIREFWITWKHSEPELSYKIEVGANMAVRAAQIWRENSGETGLKAEAYAVETLQNYISTLGLKIDVRLAYAAVKAAYHNFKQAQAYNAEPLT
jgi:hypothetical protein